VVEHLPSKRKALGSVPRFGPQLRKKEKKKKKQQQQQQKKPNKTKKLGSGGAWL